MSKKITVIIPARNELFLSQTLKDILKNFRGDYEVIAVLDGYWMKPEEIVEDPHITYLHFGEARGMRNGINMAAQMATGDYLLKCDAHVMFDEGFDLKLLEGIPSYIGKLEDAASPDQWIVIPRRKRLDADLWQIQDVGKPDVDYEALSSPADDGVKGNVWTQRIIERLGKPEYDIDENLSFQGSCWFMPKSHYLNNLGGMKEEGYGTFVREAQEIGLKTWLGGGKIYVNKKTWYAHLHKGKKFGRMYFLNSKEIDAGNKYCDDFWFNNRWAGAKFDLAWLIQRFMPVPSWTPELIEQVNKKVSIPTKFS